MESPLLADVLRARAEQNRRNIGVSSADVLRSNPAVYALMGNPQFVQGIQDAPSLLQNARQSSPASFLDVLRIATTVMGSLGQPQEGVTGGILAGPASYTVRRASPNLGTYLSKRPETFYTHFTDEMPAAVEQGLRTVGFAKPMDAQRAKDLSVIHEFLAGLGQIPTVQNVRSGALARGTARSPYQPLPRPLQAGDVELSLSKDFDPNVFRGLSGKSKATLKQQGETATHEGMHGAWLGKTKGQSGNPPLSPEQASKVMQWIHESGVDPLDVLIKMNAGTFDITHLFLEASAKRASKHVRTGR